MVWAEWLKQIKQKERDVLKTHRIQDLFNDIETRKGGRVVPSLTPVETKQR